MELRAAHQEPGESLDLTVVRLRTHMDQHLDASDFRWQLDLGRLRDLSPREREVFLLLGFGLSNRRIARVLGVTERTVKAHVGQVLSKLVLESRLQAGLAAFNLLDAPEATAGQVSGHG
jgi:DNA-binding NarL/FixJ family response regulator